MVSGLFNAMNYIVENQHIKTIAYDSLVSGSQEIYTATFEFSEEWDGYTKTAVFINDEVIIYVLLTDGSCVIPWEVLQKPGYLTVGVYGELGDQIRPTVYAAPIYIDQGTTTDGTESTEPTPSVWQQLLERVVPVGGEEGQVLAKASDGDYDLIWKTGGTGGTTDYADLINKPQIDGTTLEGNVSSDELGLAKATDIPDVSQFITRAVTDLVNYYTKTQTDEAILDAIGQITQIEFRVVETLPATGENGVIYLVPKADAEVQNIKTEYIYVSGEWEKIGETSVDLSDYYTKTQTDALLVLKADATTLANHIADAVKHITAQERTAWNNKADQTALNNYYTKAETDDLLAPSETHMGDTTKHITAQERTTWNAKASQTDLTAHTDDAVKHITAQERTAWNGKAEASDLTTHEQDTVKHITAQERTAWNSKASQTDLTSHTGDANIHTTAQEKAAWNAKADDQDLQDHIGDTVKHITAAERTAWNAKLDNLTETRRMTAEDRIDDAYIGGSGAITYQPLFCYQYFPYFGGDFVSTADVNDGLLHFHDKDKNWISGLGWDHLVSTLSASDIPAGTAYISLSAKKTNADSVVVVQHTKEISGKEDKTNKVTALSSTSTDDEYPSAKCVYDIIGDIETALTALL